MSFLLPSFLFLFLFLFPFCICISMYHDCKLHNSPIGISSSFRKCKCRDREWERGGKLISFIVHFKLIMWFDILYMPKWLYHHQPLKCPSTPPVYIVSNPSPPSNCEAQCQRHLEKSYILVEQNEYNSAVNTKKKKKKDYGSENTNNREYKSG
jgi:hypothetical protein